MLFSELAARQPLRPAACALFFNESAWILRGVTGGPPEMDYSELACQKIRSRTVLRSFGTPTLASSLLRDTKNLDSNIVWAATFLGEIHQLKTSVLGIVLGGKLKNLLLLHLAPKAVRAEHQHVCRFKRKGRFRALRGDRMARAQGSSQNVSLGVSLSFLGSNYAIFDQAADIGMVVGEALK